MQEQLLSESLLVHPIGIIRSSLSNLSDCPLQGAENAPDALLAFNVKYVDAYKDIAVGDKLIVLTWFHLADREVLKCYKGRMVGTQEFGVFSTRSPDRPNPVGLHSVTVMQIVSENVIRIFPMEALDGTPVIDVKPVI
jgi:tRNA-Thr(GGU) m(6)t(6)A37 methyltransferase TsaA